MKVVDFTKRSALRVFRAESGHILSWQPGRKLEIWKMLKEHWRSGGKITEAQFQSWKAPKECDGAEPPHAVGDVLVAIDDIVSFDASSVKIIGVGFDHDSGEWVYTCEGVDDPLLNLDLIAPSGLGQRLTDYAKANPLGGDHLLAVTSGDSQHLLVADSYASVLKTWPCLGINIDLHISDLGPAPEALTGGWTLTAPGQRWHPGEWVMWHYPGQDHPWLSKIERRVSESDLENFELCSEEDDYIVSGEAGSCGGGGGGFMSQGAPADQLRGLTLHEKEQWAEFITANS